MSFLKILGIIAQVFISIPKVASIIKSIIEEIQKQFEIKARKDRDKKIKAAIELAKKNKDASALEELLK